MTGVPAPLEHALVDFLRRHPPFDAMAAADLSLLARNAKLGYYAKGEAITGRAIGAARTLYIVERGEVQANPGEEDLGRDALEFSVGECFPLTALMAQRSSTLDYVARTDTFTYEVDRATFDTVLAQSTAFHRHCTARMDALLEQATAKVRELYAGLAAGGQTLNRTLASIVKSNARKRPVTVTPATPLRRALEVMRAERIGSVVVVDAQARPLGLFTERALVGLALADTLALDAPIERLMNATPLCMPDDTLLAEAMVAMVEHGSRYVLVVRAEQLVGVVSERDLFALQRQTMAGVLNTIAAAEGDDALVQAAAEIRQLTRNLLAQGIGAEPLTRLVARLNDKLTQRVLELERTRHDLAGIAFCWIALGSEGRHEQTIATDQDNAIAFRAEPAAADAIRARLLPFAQAVNTTLDHCGFPLCMGNVMASNSALCLSVDEWRARFTEWIVVPSPEAILNASIFFDLRALAGDATLVDELRSYLVEHAPAQRIFLRTLAENALTTRAPLGFFGDLVTSGVEAARGTLDLKAQGTRLFVDAARVHALAHGVTLTNTAARMREAGRKLGIPHEEIEAAVDAFHFVLLLRLRHQDAAAVGEHPNRIDPRELNDLDRRILKEALRQAARLQDRLRLDYQL